MRWLRHWWHRLVRNEWAATGTDITGETTLWRCDRCGHVWFE